MMRSAEVRIPFLPMEIGQDTKMPTLKVRESLEETFLSTLLVS